MLAHAFVTALAAVARLLEERAADWIELTTNEIHCLFRAVVRAITASVEQVLAELIWR
jgi:aspartate/glutamate racemase